MQMGKKLNKSEERNHFSTSITKNENSTEVGCHGGAD